MKYSVGSVHNTKVGPVEVLERVAGTKKILIRFLNTGGEKIVYRETLTRGNLKDNNTPAIMGIGYVGYGEYTPKTHKRLYDTWASMLKRCYAGYAHNPTYVGCTVVPEWHNFQTFAEWASNNGYTADTQLDKDIKIVGNRIYGPDQCLLVSPEANRAEKNGRYVEKVSHEYSLLHVESGEVITGKNKNEFIRNNGFNRNFFSQLESGAVLTSHGYRLPVSYFALAGECDGNVRR